MYDSVFVLVEAFNRIIRKKPDQFRSYTMRRQNGQANSTAAKFLDCNTSKGWVTQWEHGERIAKNLRKVEIEGLTGEIRFNDEGKRINYTLHIVEMTGNGGMTIFILVFLFRLLLPPQQSFSWSIYIRISFFSSSIFIIL